MNIIEAFKLNTKARRPIMAERWGNNFWLKPGTNNVSINAEDILADDWEVIPTCKDCGIPTIPGRGSARCPACWEDRCDNS